MRGRKPLLSVLKQLDRDLTDAFQNTVNQINQILVSEAGNDGIVPANRIEIVRRRVGIVVQRLFVGPDGFSAFGSDGVTALSPYAQALNKAYAQITYEAIKAHHDWLKANIPDNVFQFLASATKPLDIRELTEIEHLRVMAELARYEHGVCGVDHHHVHEQEDANPFLRLPDETDETFRKRLDDLRVLHNNPMAEIDPARRWVPYTQWKDSKGYRLSDRIWRAGEETRRKIDLLLIDALEDGTDVLKLSKTLEQFLLPGRANLRTNKPYGTNASYDAMRLARSEIASAANRASYLSSYLNPYVDRMDVARSGTGDPTCPICPQFASISIYGDRVRPPYELGGVPIPIFHPFCKCLVIPVVADSPSTVTARLQALVEDERNRAIQASVNPAALDQIVAQLLGNELLRLVVQAAV